MLKLKRVKNLCLMSLVLASAQTQRCFAIERNPANFVPDDEVMLSPVQEGEVWVNKILVQDSAGVLDGVKRNIELWQKRDEFERKWDVRIPGTAATPDLEARKIYLKQRALKYLDKRISGEVRNADKGSTLHTIGAVQKALKPSSEVKFSSKFKLKFKAQILQRQAKVYIVNPYIDNKLEVNMEGQMILYLNKKFESLKVNSDVRVDFNNSSYVASLTRPITKNINAQLSSSQSMNNRVFSESSDGRLQLRYSSRF